MFTFHPHDNPIQLNQKTTIAPIPDLVPPSKLFSLPPLHFSSEAAEPISNLTPAHNPQQVKKYKQLIQSLELKHKDQLSKMNDKLTQLYDEYMRQKRQHQMLKQRYREGQAIFIQLESENQNLQRQLSALRVKKSEKNRNSNGKPKQIPIVKINVPNPKNMVNNEEILDKKLKQLSQQLANTKKTLQIQTNEAKNSQNILQKTIAQLTTQNQVLKQQSLFLRDQIQRYKGRQTTKNIYRPYQDTKNIFTVTQEDQHQLERVKDQLERLKRVHRSCDVLIASKQTQIYNMRLQLSRANQKLANLPVSPSMNQKWDGKIQNVHQQSRSTVFPHKMDQSSLNQTRTQYLQQHLNLSVKEMKGIESYIRSLLQDYMNKIKQLRSEIQWANKKSEHQQFELERVYQLLRDKKAQLENCYRDLMSAKKNIRNSPRQAEEDANMKSLLQNRREFSL